MGTESPKRRETISNKNIWEATYRFQRSQQQGGISCEPRKCKGGDFDAFKAALLRLRTHIVHPKIKQFSSEPTD